MIHDSFGGGGHGGLNRRRGRQGEGGNEGGGEGGVKLKLKPKELYGRAEVPIQSRGMPSAQKIDAIYDSESPSSLNSICPQAKAHITLLLLSSYLSTWLPLLIPNQVLSFKLN